MVEHRSSDNYNKPMYNKNLKTEQCIQNLLILSKCTLHVIEFLLPLTMKLNIRVLLKLLTETSHFSCTAKFHLKDQICQIWHWFGKKKLNGFMQIDSQFLMEKKPMFVLIGPNVSVARIPLY